MKVQLELDMDLSARAVFRNDEIKIMVTGSIPYNGRNANASVEGASEKVTSLFIKAFEALLAEKQEQVTKLAQAAHAECVTVAARMGEL